MGQMGQMGGPPQHQHQQHLYKSSTPADKANRRGHDFVGPILRINSKVARYSDKNDIEERVLLQSTSDGEITKSVLKLENVGSTRISFHFRRVNNDSIGLHPPRFFFNRLGGCVLPGETINFPFYFKSNKPGIFSESWVLVTEPALLNSGAISLRLYAIA